MNSALNTVYIPPLPLHIRMSTEHFSITEMAELAFAEYDLDTREMLAAWEALCDKHEAEQLAEWDAECNAAQAAWEAECEAEQSECEAKEEEEEKEAEAECEAEEEDAAWESRLDQDDDDRREATIAKWAENR